MMNYEEGMNQIINLLDQADAIVIGAGSRLSSAAGLLFSEERFKKYFSDFEAKYDFHDMYTGRFYPYSTQAEKWAF